MAEPGAGPAGGGMGDIRAYRNSFIGIGALACDLFLIFGTWPLYGAWGAFGQFAVWLILFALGCRWFSPHPGRVLLLGLASVALWTGVVLLCQ